MSQLIHIDIEYSNWISSLSERYRQSQIKAFSNVNREMLRFYWELGSDIVRLKAEEKWPDNFWKNLHQDLSESLNGIGGLSVTNLQYTKRFFLLYNQLITNNPQVVGDLFLIPWGHHRYIIDKYFSEPEKALFFVRKTIENQWSRSVLLNFLDTDLYERQGKAVSNFSATLPDSQSDLAQQITKDPYCFDFLDIRGKYMEKELKDQLVRNIEKFLLELGRGFAYMGREFRLQIGQEEKFMDMLFYNVNLRCYVVVEVKVEKFDASHLGQLGLYVSGVNHLLKKEWDNPTLGLLICKSKDNVVAQYALDSSSVPIGISEYDLQQIYPKEYKSSLPTIEEIENEFEK